MDSKDIVPTTSSSSKATASKLNAEYSPKALARILVQISKGGPPPPGHSVHNIYWAAAEAPNLKGLFSLLASEREPEPEPSSLELSDFPLSVKPKRIIRFFPKPQEENPTSESHKVQNPLNPSATPNNHPLLLLLH